MPVTGPGSRHRHNEADPNWNLTDGQGRELNMKEGRELNVKEGRKRNVKLFTITASIIALVAGIAAYTHFVPGDRQGRGYWCPKIVAEETVQRETFHDDH